jgi:glycosyltransferase involved in cell wall biosynthesis
MKRIGVLTYDFYPFEGGQGRHIYDIYYRGLLMNDYHNVFFFSPCKNQLKNNFTYFNFTKRSGKNFLYSLLINFKVTELQKKYKIEVFNLHAGPGGLFLFKKPKISLVVTAHHTYFQQIKFLKDQWWKIIFIPFEKRTYKLADKIISVSETTKKTLVENYDIDPSKITVIPNCIDSQRFKKLPKVNKIPNSILFVGRLDKRKGIDFLLKAMPQILEKNPKIKLFIGGKGKLFGWCKKFINENKLENSVKMLGFIPDEDLVQWYNKCELFVIPSIFEGFGITALEAISCGSPVIATNTDGLSEILSPIQNSLIKRSKKSLVDVLSNRFTISIPSKYIQKYDCRNIAMNTTKFYNEI